MHLPALALLALLSSLSAAQVHNSTCPQIFLLTAQPSPANQSAWYANQPIIQSGASTYIGGTLPAAGSSDSLATFYRNDSTHLYATGFNTSYWESHQTPPYQLITLAEEGWNTFASDPAANERVLEYVTGDYTVVESEVGDILTFDAADGGIGGWWICGATGSTIEIAEVLVGTQGFSPTNCDEVQMLIVPQAQTIYDVC